MKKFTLAIAGALLFIFIFTACSANTESDINSQSEQPNSSNSVIGSDIVNPLVKSNADEIAQKLGFYLGVPTGAENIKYFILAGNTEELRFTLDGIDYTARLKSAPAFEDISGMHYKWTITLSDKLKGCESRQMRYTGNGDDIDVCLWYDAAKGLMYSLTATGGSLDGFDITAAALQIYAPSQKSVKYP